MVQSVRRVVAVILVTVVITMGHWKRILRTIWIELCPYKRRSYFIDFFDRVDRVQRRHDRKTIIYLRMQMSLLGLVSLSLLGFYLFPAKDERYRYLFFDYIAIFGWVSECKFLLAIVGIELVCFYELAYFRSSLAEMEQLLVFKRANFFPGQYYYGRPICDLISTVSINCLNLLQPFMIIINIFHFYCQYLIVRYVFDHHEHFLDNLLRGLLELVAMEVSVLAISFFFYAMGHICILISTLFMTTFAMTYIRFNQIEQILYPRGSGGRRICFYRFKRLHTETVLFVFRSNQLFGKCIMLFLVCNAPLNAFLWMNFNRPEGGSSSSSTPMMLFINACFISQQSLCFSCFHVMCAWFTKKIHGSCRRLLCINFRIRRASLRQRLVLSDYICKYSAKNRYGFTAGPLWMISMINFVKFILFYSEILMFSYSLVSKLKTATP